MDCVGEEGGSGEGGLILRPGLGSLSPKQNSSMEVTHGIHSLLPPHVLVIHSFMQQIGIAQEHCCVGITEPV